MSTLAIRAAELSIKIKFTPDASEVYLTTPYGGSAPPAPPLQGGIGSGALAEHREKLDIALDSFMVSIAGATGCDEQMDRKRPETADDWGEISNAVETLHRWGRIFLYNFVGESNVATLEAQCRAACPGWRNEAGRPHLIEVTSDLNYLVPIEFLPLFDTRRPPKIRGPESLRAALRTFAGFSTIIRRVGDRLSLSQKTSLEDDSGLPVKFFHHQDLNAVEREFNYLKTHRRAAVEGPWPTSPVASLPDDLANFLANPSLTFEGKKKRPPDQIQHFSCHCVTNEQPSLNNYLELADAADSYMARIEDIQDSLVARGDAAAPPDSLPLIFLNACGSSVIRPEGAGFFPSFFLRRGNCGVIGTETNIPQAFAAAFSIQFYKHLLSQRPRNTLGEAIHRAKWTMIEHYSNPLGIMYTLYADPDISLESNRRPAGRARGRRASGD